MRKTKTSRTQSLRVRHMTIYSWGETLWSRSLIEPYISSSLQLSLMCCDRCSLLFAVFLENWTNLPRRTEDWLPMFWATNVHLNIIQVHVKAVTCLPVTCLPGVFFLLLCSFGFFFSCNRWKDTGTLSLLYNISIWI